jgi:hypothetical protein
MAIAPFLRGPMFATPLKPDLAPREVEPDLALAPLHPPRPSATVRALNFQNGVDTPAND